MWEKLGHLCLMGETRKVLSFANYRLPRYCEQKLLDRGEITL